MPEPQANPIVTVTATQPVKPGWKTSEFWLKLAAISLSALFASGAIPTSGPVAQVAAIGATLLLSLGYTVSRTLVKTATMIFIVMLAMDGATACGPSGRAKAFQDTYATLNAAQIAFVTYDGIHQHDIVVKSPDEETFNRTIHEWRGTQLTIEQIFTDAYKDLANAVIVNDDPSLTTAVNALADVKKQLTALGVKL